MITCLSPTAAGGSQMFMQMQPLYFHAQPPCEWGGVSPTQPGPAFEGFTTSPAALPSMVVPLSVVAVQPAFEAFTTSPAAPPSVAVPVSVMAMPQPPLAEVTAPPPEPAPAGAAAGPGARPQTRSGRRKQRNATCRASAACASVPSMREDPSQEPADHTSMEAQAPTEEELTELLDSPNKASQAQALNAIQGHVKDMSFHSQESCRVVQLALEKASKPVQRDLVAELKGCVREATRSPYANFVIQKIVEVVPVALTGFIVDEMIGTGQDAARHRCACRVLLRLLEHGDMANPKLNTLFQELLGDATIVKLSKHPFGTHVIRALFEHGSAEQRQLMGEALLGRFWALGDHLHGSHVIEAAWKYGPVTFQHALCRLAGERPDAFASLGEKRYGSFVVRLLAAGQ